MRRLRPGRRDPSRGVGQKPRRHTGSFAAADRSRHAAGDRRGKIAAVTVKDSGETVAANATEQSNKEESHANRKQVGTVEFSGRPGPGRSGLSGLAEHPGHDQRVRERGDERSGQGDAQGESAVSLTKRQRKTAPDDDPNKPPRVLPNTYWTRKGGGWILEFKKKVKREWLYERVGQNGG